MGFHEFMESVEENTERMVRQMLMKRKNLGFHGFWELNRWRRKREKGKD